MWQRSYPALIALFVFCVCVSAESTAQQTVPSSVQSDLSKDLSKIQGLIEQYNQVESLKNKVSEIKPDKDPLLSWDYSKFAINSKDYEVVVDSIVDIKKSASVNSDTIAKLPKGAFFRKIGEDGGFYQVDLSGKTGWIPKASTVQPQFVNYDSMMKAIEEKVTKSIGFDEIIASLVEMREKWKSNQYLEAEGFDISLGIPLSVNFSFKFK